MEPNPEKRKGFGQKPPTVGRNTPSIGSGSKSGLCGLKRAVRVLGNRVVDRRTTVGNALAGWRDELTGDLGGDTAISTQQRALVDLVVRTKLMLDSIDAWLLKQPSLVNARKRSLLPVVRERTQLADAIARLCLLETPLARRGDHAQSCTP